MVFAFWRPHFSAPRIMFQSRFGHCFICTVATSGCLVLRTVFADPRAQLKKFFVLRQWVSKWGHFRGSMLGSFQGITKSWMRHSGCFPGSNISITSRGSRTNCHSHKGSPRLKYLKTLFGTDLFGLSDVRPILNS